MRRLPDVKRCIIITITGTVLAATVKIAWTIHCSEPQPLSDNEILRIHNAIQAVSPGDIHDLRNSMRL